MKNSPIANNIRDLRKSRRWTQEELAFASGVDVRTIQRAESGRPLALETLRSIAAAFDTDIDSLNVSEAQTKQAIDEFHQKYLLIELKEIGDQFTLRNLFEGVLAFQIHLFGMMTEIQLDEIACFEQEFRDCLDIWGEIEPVGRRGLEKGLLSQVSHLNAYGLRISAGLENLRLDTRDRNSPCVFDVAHIAVSSGESAVRIVARDRSHPISFV